MKHLVQADGPKDARVLWVGEAPGRYEVIQGKPFIGPSGQMVRRTLRWAGIDPERDVRYTNVALENPGTFPTGRRGALLIKRYADALDGEINSMPELKVVVACGGQALTRLTGRTGILDWSGSVLHSKDLPDVFDWNGIKHERKVPKNVVIIAALHPAGIMRSKGRDDTVLFRRQVHKVRNALDGALVTPKYHTSINPNLQTLLNASKRSKVVYFDTEFDRESKQIFYIGMSFNDHIVYGMQWTKEYAEFALQILTSKRYLKCAHNITADADAIYASSGVEITEPWYDTMIGMHSLHPALGVGLNDTTLFYLDDVKNWKDMETTDPAYNAMDVHYGWMCREKQLNEARDRPVSPMTEMEWRMRLLWATSRMTRRGMRVSQAEQARLRADVQGKITKLREQVAYKVAPIWDKRVRVAMGRWEKVERKYLELKNNRKGECPKHPTFNGLRKPAASCELCQTIHAETEALRTEYEEIKPQRIRCKAEMERWQEGFQPRNNEHLRWLLYDPEALKLPVQRSQQTRKPTANRMAIDKLATLRTVQARTDAYQLVLDIKEVQHLEKALSTFLDIPVDENYVAHPRYKVHGTRTGRLAGGSDTDEKSDNRYAFNPLNIPREWRRMYVPAAGCVFVAADWRNVEGRLTAHFCGDSAYTAALQGELRGGPKVHAINAGIIYGIEPSEAKRHAIQLSGQERTAYDGGKRLTHAWSYGMKPLHMSRTFNIPLKEAVEIDEKLSEAYPRLVSWRQQLIHKVLGVWEQTPGDTKWRCIENGSRLLTNPFGWQLHFLGHAYDQANEVVAFLPQSTGAGLWTRCAVLLEERFHIYTGTYDSFVLEVPRTQVCAAVKCVREIMERKWPELGGKSFPIEVQVGENWGEYDEADNMLGLKEVA